KSGHLILLYNMFTYTSIDSERSDECIDFTMLCVFFVCLCTRERVEIKLQFQTLGVVSDSKMNLVGALGRSNFPIVFKSARKNKKKIKEKREFSRKTMSLKKFWMNKSLNVDKIRQNHEYLQIIFITSRKNAPISNYGGVDKNFLDDQKVLKV
ncbi:Uncharacterized protein FWK35_00004746, partial [Aphis craccivora]